MRLVVPLVLAFVLACSGAAPPPAPEPAPEPVAAPDPDPAPAPEPVAVEEPEEADWIEAVVDEAIDMETQPGTSPDGSDEQRARLRAFFEAHPEYREASERQKLADLACAFGIEDAHAKLTSPEPRTPLTVTVTADGWKLVVAHASDWCTSDDWAWFTNDVQTAVTAKGVLWDYAGARNDAVVVMRDGAELVRVPLEGQGYLVLGDGVEKAEIGHDMADGVITSIGEHFGMELGATE